MKYNAILVRYGEISVKGVYTRKRMHSLLARNIEEALKTVGEEKAKVKVIPGRIVVREITDPIHSSQVIARVFGVTSVSPVYEGDFTSLEDLIEKVADLVIDDVENKVFMVRARRAGRQEFTSKDIERKLGEKLLQMGGSKVNLETPDIVVGVEVRDDKYFVYITTLQGPGGLPIGSEGKLLALVSGGFDSAVAAWMMMKRGAKVDLAFFNIGGEEHLTRVMEIARVLSRKWGYGYKQKLHIVEHRWIFPLLEMIPVGFRTIALKRTMYIAAEAIAHDQGAKALVTGESLAQVASQTLHNLVVTEESIGIPVFRPLIGFDKEEIIEKTRYIGTYEISSKVKEFCAIASTKPSIGVDRKKLNELMEKHLPRKMIKQKALENKKTIVL